MTTVAVGKAEPSLSASGPGSFFVSSSGQAWPGDWQPAAGEQFLADGHPGCLKLSCPACLALEAGGSVNHWSIEELECGSTQPWWMCLAF